MTLTGTEPATERALLESFAGTFTISELYDAVEAAGTDLTARSDGHAVIHGVTDQRWKRRVRGALQGLKRSGRAHREGPSVWVLDGPPARPRAAVLVSLTGTHGQVELRLADAATLLAGMDEPADLILTDPPYGLGVGTGTDTGSRTYQRDQSKVVSGYVDVDPARYRDFTNQWVASAAAAIRPGGHLVVITGPQQAAWAQVAAEDAGLTWVNSLAVGRVFALRTTRRFANSHWTVLVATRGGVHDRARVFNCPPDLPKARSGADYPLDLWPVGDVGRADAKPGQLRYPNSLPVKLVDRLVGAFTRRDPVEEQADDQELVVDPFVGGGTTSMVCASRGLRFLGADVNPAALAFTTHRVSRMLLDRTSRLEIPGV